MVRRLLTVGHSYVVGLNRRLADEMARVGSGRWDVTVVAPRFLRGDLRPIALEAIPDEVAQLEPIKIHGSGRPHLMVYSHRLRGLLRGGWDLVHCWEEPYVASGLQVAWWTPPGVPFVFWSAQNLSKQYPPPFSWFERYCLQRASGWLACGQTTIEALSARGYAAKPHQAIPLGVDLKAFCPDPTAGASLRASLGWAAGPPVIGYLGRFAHEKGVTFLTRVLDQLPVPWRALFVGGGPLETHLRAWARSHGDRVRICTGVPHDRVSGYLNAMDLLAAPSLTTHRWREQLGRMLVEAFACGVPVVGSSSGEIPHVIGHAGLVVAEGDEGGWTAALSQLVASPARRTEFAALGLHRAQTHYAWPIIAQQHLRFFDEITST